MARRGTPQGHCHDPAGVAARGAGFVIKESETPDSEPVIDLPPEVAAILQKVRERQLADAARRAPCPDGEACRRRHCRGRHPLDLVFCQPSSKPLHDSLVRVRDPYPLCRKLGLPWRRALHNMRQAHGSHLLERGISLRAVSERLGHRDPAFTARVYVYVLRGQAQAAEAVSTMLRGCTSFAHQFEVERSVETLEKQWFPKV